MVIPPRQYKLEEGVRAKITKTFQKVYIDDYGPDNPQLTISGFSGTSQAFRTYRATENDDRAYQSKDAFYVFRDSILHYRYREDYENKRLYVYDLADEQAYDCFLQEFNLERSAEAPFFYPYTINLFIIGRLDNVKDTQSILTEGDVNEEMKQAEEINQELPKAVQPNALDQGNTDLLESSDNDKIIWDYIDRGGIYRFTREDGRETAVLSYPEDEFTDAEIVAVRAAVEAL